MNLAKNRVPITFAVGFLILAVSLVAIFWARGFKPDFKKARIERTGLIVASSTPTGAQVYLNDRLTSATDTNIAFLDPKTYKVRIEKDGYTAWEKEIEVKADLATEVKAVLFPTAPEIKPLTLTGATNPVLSPDGAKIIYGVAGIRGGAFLLPMNDRPFPFRQDARLLIKNTAAFDFSKAQFLWDPDSKTALARFVDQAGSPRARLDSAKRGEAGQAFANILIDSDKSTQEPLDVSGSLTSTLTSWQEQLITRAQTLALTVPDSVKQATAEASPVTTDSALSTQHSALNYYPTGLIFSPDEEKVLYKTQDRGYKVYDFKNKKEYALPNFSDLANIAWYPDSNHLVVAQKDQIAIIEADGTNKTVVYSGKFENGFVFPHPSGNRLIILTTLTQPDGTLPNLYSINLK